MPKPYHRRFHRINRTIQHETKNLLSGWATATQSQQWVKCERWLDAAAWVYQIDRPRLVRDANADTGYYTSPSNEIHMAYPSVVTLLHEFRHAMQWLRPEVKRSSVDMEDDARAWSLSLYATVAPRSFRRLVSEGKILHIHLNDLTTT